MYRYNDPDGNVFELREEGPVLLCAALGDHGIQDVSVSASSSKKELVETRLDFAAYMRLVSAFTAAIDNKVFHRELCNPCSGVIFTWEDGQQRRYILSENSPERRDLEATLYDCLAAVRPVNANPSPP